MTFRCGGVRVRPVRQETAVLTSFGPNRCLRVPELPLKKQKPSHGPVVALIWDKHS